MTSVSGDYKLSKLLHIFASGDNNNFNQILSIMKKIIILAAAILGFTLAVSAQPRAVGGRFGYGAELSYQHYMGGANFIEADLGLGEFKFLNLAATYNFMIAQPDWTSQGEWGFYAGPGIAIAAGNEAFNIGIAGQVGLEYTFSFPLQISIDLRPQFSFTNLGFWGWAPHLGLRYRF